MLMRFSTLGSSSMEISNTTPNLFDLQTILNVQISYAKHVLDPF